MKLGIIMKIVIITTIFEMVNTMKSQFQSEHDYYDFEPELAAANSANDVQKSNNIAYSGVQRSDGNGITESSVQLTTCITLAEADDAQDARTEGIAQGAAQASQGGTQGAAPGVTPVVSAVERPATSLNNDMGNCIPDNNSKELQNLVQLLYIAQARVQLEASEIKKAQAVANSAQHSLEEASNNVRAITSALQSAQQEVANAAIRAQTAQLQLAAHDQLLFAARQDVDALSSQMVALQAAEGISEPKLTIDLANLLEKLKQPLKECEQPTAIPPVVPLPVKSQLHREYESSLNRNSYYN